jgi:hypothetical protein
LFARVANGALPLTDTKRKSLGVCKEDAAKMPRL